MYTANCTVLGEGILSAHQSSWQWGSSGGNLTLSVSHTHPIPRSLCVWVFHAPACVVALPVLLLILSSSGALSPASALSPAQSCEVAPFLCLFLSQYLKVTLRRLPDNQPLFWLPPPQYLSTSRCVVHQGLSVWLWSWEKPQGGNLGTRPISSCGSKWGFTSQEFYLWPLPLL